MWKLISLSVFLIVAQAADIHDFYGDWIQVAFYPVSTYVPMCIRFTYAKSTESVQCTYADGRNATVVQVTIVAESGGYIIERQQVPMIPMRVVDTLAEVMPALNVSVKCGDKVFRASDRPVVKLVNADYFILYSNIPASKEDTRTAVEQNSAILFGRNVVPAKELEKVMMSIEELKNRRGAQMCVKENYGGFKDIEDILKFR